MGLMDMAVKKVIAIQVIVALDVVSARIEVDINTVYTPEKLPAGIGSIPRKTIPSASFSHQSRSLHKIDTGFMIHVL